MMRLLRIITFLWVAVLSSALYAQESGAKTKWVAVFEQSYGTEGLYPFELYPRDEAANSRLNLQKLNAAAAKLREQKPGVTPGIATLKAAKLLPELAPPADGESYQWDDQAGSFSSSLGGDHGLLNGAVRLMSGSETIRDRILRPTSAVRQRWKKIYSDSASPEFLKREIVLREFLLEHAESEAVRAATKIHETLQLLDEATKLYALANNLQLGDPVTLDELRASRLIGFIERLPPEVELTIDKVGESPKARYLDMEITADPNSVTAVQRRDAEKVWKQYGQFPPALALHARFEEPDNAVQLLDEAIEQWPDVPGLRIERLAQYARARDAFRWTEDMDYLLQNFPAAPLLLELQMTAQLSGMTEDPESRERFSTMLADVRPDLLGHQLYAIGLARETGNDKNHDRLVSRLAKANPVWRIVLPDSDAETSPP